MKEHRTLGVQKETGLLEAEERKKRNRELLRFSRIVQYP